MFAYDLAREIAARPVIEYFLEAATRVRQNKERYLAAEARARDRHPDRPAWFDVAALSGLSSS